MNDLDTGNSREKFIKKIIPKFEGVFKMNMFFARSSGVQGFLKFGSIL